MVPITQLLLNKRQQLSPHFLCNDVILHLELYEDLDFSDKLFFCISYHSAILIWWKKYPPFLDMERSWGYSCSWSNKIIGPGHQLGWYQVRPLKP